MNIRKIFSPLVVVASILFIIYLGVWVRLPTINTPTVLDYDPFWFARHAKEILENNFQVPSWDLQSFYPPGRPTEPFQGWAYTIVLFYKFLQFFIPNITLTQAAILSPLLMVALIPILAFLLGKILTGSNITGLFVALFAVLTPTFIGVSMAGYSDSDAPVVFYSFLSTLSVFLALKKSFKKLKSIPFYIFAILANLLFVFNWGGGWLTLMLFSVFIVGLFIFRYFEEAFHQMKLKIDVSNILQELKSLLPPLVLIILVTNFIGYLLWHSNMLHSFIGGLAFTGLAGEPLLVNISVAELQPINIFSKEGFLAVASRVGLLPVILTFFGLPLLVLYKIYKKERIRYEEIFLFLWAFVMFFLITRGVRFSLLFSIASAVSAGYVIGNLFNYLKGRNVLIFSTTFGFIVLLTLMFISDAIQFGLASSGMLLSQNWYDMLDWLKANADKDSLIVTWWDPGHIIAGYTGLKVHADGAHCPPGVCIPYNHNIRIQDMGRVFSTSSEEEAIRILRKYLQLTPDQIKEVKQKFGDRVPEEAFKPVSEMYLIASSDLIGKYYWMSYFGTGTGRNFFQFPFSGFDQGFPTYGNIITLTQKEDKLIAIMNIPQQGIRNAIIKEVVYYQNGVEQRAEYSNANTIDGLLWVDPSFRVVIFMEPQVRDSLFTKMFFWNGQGLKHFQLVYSNPEIRVFKVVF